jgi:hypothetical protein
MGQKPGRPAVPDAIPSLWRGTVVEVHSNGMVYVQVPRLARDTAIGPMPTAVGGLVQGDSVIVAAIEDSRNDLMVLAVSYPVMVDPEDPDALQFKA